MLPVFNDKTDLHSEEFLHVNSCGKEGYYGIRGTIFRPHGRRDVHILYCVGGMIEILSPDGGEVLDRVCAGEVYFYYPGEPQCYRDAAGAATEDYWFHFTGLGAKETLRRLSLWENGRRHIRVSDPQAKEIAERLVKEFRMKRQNMDTVCMGLLLEFLGVLSRCAGGDPDEGETTDRLYPVIRRMHENCAESVPLETYAAMCGLSVDRFMHVFREAAGVSCRQYLTQLRIDRARYLLGRCAMSVSETALACGFDDALYFSRVFRKQTGMSPTEYRQAANGEPVPGDSPEDRGRGGIPDGRA